MRIDGEMRDLTEEIELNKNISHTIEIVVDRLVVKDGIRSRLFDSIKTALQMAEGYVIIDVIDGKEIF